MDMKQKPDKKNAVRITKYTHGETESNKMYNLRMDWTIMFRGNRWPFSHPLSHLLSYQLPHSLVMALIVACHRMICVQVPSTWSVVATNSNSSFSLIGTHTQRASKNIVDKVRSSRFVSTAIRRANNVRFVKWFNVFVFTDFLFCLFCFYYFK